MASFIPLKSAMSSAFCKGETGESFFLRLFEYCKEINMVSAIQDPFSENEEFFVKEVTAFEFENFIVITYIFYDNDVPLAYTVPSTCEQYSDLEINATHEILPITGITTDTENSPPEFATLRDLYNQHFRGTFDNIYKHLSGYMKPLDIFIRLCFNLVVIRDYTPSELDELYGSLETELDDIFEEKTRAYEGMPLPTENYDEFDVRSLVFQFEKAFRDFGTDLNDGVNPPELKSETFVGGVAMKIYTKYGLDFYNYTIDRENIYGDNKDILYKTNIAEMELDKTCLVQMLSYDKNAISTTIDELYENVLHGSAYALKREMHEKNYSNADIFLFMYLSVCIHKKLIAELSQ